MPINEQVKLVKKEQLKNDTFKFTCKSDKISNEAKAGQFVEVKVSKTLDPILRRPISIYNIDKQNGTFEFIFQIRGRGTKLLSEFEENDLIDIVGPLGGGTFDFKKYKSIAIIGGGIGVFPLYELSKEAKETANVDIYLGFRNKDFVILEEEFKKVSNNLTITTDDGSYGKNGLAIDYLKQEIDLNKYDCIYACGPLPMLKGVKALAEEKNIPCQISLEEKMACGIGVCMGCSVKIATKDDTVKYTRVCKAGPVFDSRLIEI
ncbi:MAG: dihydroorotate dehydrogenase electron transfer subunit [Lachnospiraceae bacterium]|jgi:dihydroorotate dehydrogenase electron transfer subunit|nr:dihydroorotate dehydrogenase electron transfer subunit [Lachnospiraceae bacterium]